MLNGRSVVLDDKIAFTVEEAAKLSSICRSNVFKAIREKRLEARKLGRRTIILQEDLRRYLESLPLHGGVNG